MSDQLNLDALLKNEPWIRGLAQGLLSDPGAVDDVVQRTLEAAVETPPQDPAKLKSWLGSVARNAAREQHRRRASRARRERAAAAPESLPSGLRSRR